MHIEDLHNKILYHIYHSPFAHLQAVRLIKSNTDLGLKDSKSYYENFLRLNFNCEYKDRLEIAVHKKKEFNDEIVDVLKVNGYCEDFIIKRLCFIRELIKDESRENIFIPIEINKRKHYYERIDR